ARIHHEQAFAQELARRARQIAKFHSWSALRDSWLQTYRSLCESWAEVTRQLYWSLLPLLNDGNYVESSDRSTLDRVKCMLLQTGNESCVDIWNLYGGAICSSAGKAPLERGVCFLWTAEDRRQSD